MKRFAIILILCASLSSDSCAQSLPSAIRQYSTKSRIPLDRYWGDYKFYDKEFRQFIRSFPAKPTVPRMIYTRPTKDGGYMQPYRSMGFQEEEGLVEYISHLPAEYVVDVFFRESREETRGYFLLELLSLASGLYSFEEIIKGIYLIKDSLGPHEHSYAGRISARLINSSLDGLGEFKVKPSREVRLMTAHILKDYLVLGAKEWREVFPSLAPSVGGEMPGLLYDQLHADEDTQKLCVIALKKIPSADSRRLLLRFKNSKFNSVRVLAQNALKSQTRGSR